MDLSRRLRRQARSLHAKLVEAGRFSIRQAQDWRISKKGTFIDGVASSDVTIDDLAISQHSSIRLRIGIADDARNTGGINIFGRGFGNYGRDILMRIDLAQ